MSPSDFDSSGDKEAIEHLVARLAELRAMFARVDQRRLEGDDWAVASALLSELIDQAAPGQQWVTIEFSDEEELGRARGSVWRVQGAALAEQRARVLVRRPSACPAPPCALGRRS